MRLDRVCRQQLHATFCAAFGDYAVNAAATSEKRLHARMVKNNVDYDVSVGVFDGDRMVGFTMVGIDTWQGERSAFDAATGIVPGYRGQGLAGRMFEHTLPELRARGVSRFVLEVLQSNEAAIRAYQKSGFTITRELTCYELAAADLVGPRSTPPAMTIEPVERATVTALADQVDWPPSWENSFAAIERLPDAMLTYGAMAEGKCVGAIAHSPLMGWLMSLVVDRTVRRRGIASALVEHLVRHLPAGVTELKAVNIQADDAGMCRCFEGLGFRHWVDQYEMARPL